jgi:predicted transposase/invertase (TIGR01784 family)
LKNSFTRLGVSCLLPNIFGGVRCFHLSEEERKQYGKYLINVAREKDMLQTAEEEGGIKKGKKEIALVLIEKKYDTQQIHEITGLTFEEIEKLREK